MTINCIQWSCSNATSESWDMAQGCNYSGVFWLLKFLVSNSTWHAGNSDDCQRWRAVLLVKTREMSEPASATDDSVTTRDQWLGSIASVSDWHWVDWTGRWNAAAAAQCACVHCRDTQLCTVLTSPWRVWSSDAVGGRFQATMWAWRGDVRKCLNGTFSAVLLCARWR